MRLTRPYIARPPPRGLANQVVALGDVRGPAGGLAAAGVDEPPGRDRRQPRARVARRVLGPHPQRLQQGLLQRVLGAIEALAPPDQVREHPGNEVPPELAQRASSSRRVGSSITPGQSSEGASDMTSRTSIHSYSGSPPGPGSEET